ncbi:lasso peptide biosynthesis B2 protein [Nocardiopsis potens]|uniref:lasso peptide biosynthesis B2 protein n=1 Tax=Nocardiopsis potens TaxID=1246458 RepID=UPI0003821820|nr:lasso peptide biosynthesis B2 protein [Nocardiopsis potens]
MTALETAPRPPLSARIQALPIIGVARLLARCRPARIRAVLEVLARGAPPATAERTARIRDVIVGTSMRCAGPRCLERSIATALLCRASGMWPDWCTGVALRPFRAHAWVEAEGRPIGEDEQEIALFVTAMRVTRRER